MDREIKVQKEITEKHKYCDICGTEINRDLACSVAKCEYCSKDLCENCIDHEEQSYGDYRTVYCKKCWNIGNDFRDEIKYLQIKIDQLYEEWQRECNDEPKGL